jgi:hypothetical protein
VRYRPLQLRVCLNAKLTEFGARQWPASVSFFSERDVSGELVFTIHDTTKYRDAGGSARRAGPLRRLDFADGAAP